MRIFCLLGVITALFFLQTDMQSRGGVRRSFPLKGVAGLSQGRISSSSEAPVVTKPIFSANDFIQKFDQRFSSVFTERRDQTISTASVLLKMLFSQDPGSKYFRLNKVLKNTSLSSDIRGQLASFRMLMLYKDLMLILTKKKSLITKPVKKIKEKKQVVMQDDAFSDMFKRYTSAGQNPTVVLVQEDENFLNEEDIFSLPVEQQVEEFFTENNLTPYAFEDAAATEEVEQDLDDASDTSSVFSFSPEPASKDSGPTEKSLVSKAAFSASIESFFGLSDVGALRTASPYGTAFVASQPDLQKFFVLDGDLQKLYEVINHVLKKVGAEFLPNKEFKLRCVLGDAADDVEFEDGLTFRLSDPKNFDGYIKNAFSVGDTEKALVFIVFDFIKQLLSTELSQILADEGDFVFEKALALVAAEEFFFTKPLGYSYQKRKEEIDKKLSFKDYSIALHDFWKEMSLSKGEFESLWNDIFDYSILEESEYGPHPFSGLSLLNRQTKPIAPMLKIHDRIKDEITTFFVNADNCQTLRLDLESLSTLEQRTGEHSFLFGNLSAVASQFSETSGWLASRAVGLTGQVKSVLEKQRNFYENGFGRDLFFINPALFSMVEKLLLCERLFVGYEEIYPHLEDSLETVDENLLLLLVSSATRRKFDRIYEYSLSRYENFKVLLNRATNSPAFENLRSIQGIWYEGNKSLSKIIKRFQPFGNFASKIFQDNSFSSALEKFYKKMLECSSLLDDAELEQSDREKLKEILLLPKQMLNLDAENFENEFEIEYISESDASESSLSSGAVRKQKFGYLGRIVRRFSRRKSLGPARIKNIDGSYKPTSRAASRVEEGGSASAFDLTYQPQNSQLNAEKLAQTTSQKPGQVGNQAGQNVSSGHTVVTSLMEKSTPISFSYNPNPAKTPDSDDARELEFLAELAMIESAVANVEDQKTFEDVRKKLEALSEKIQVFFASRAVEVRQKRNEAVAKLEAEKTKQGVKDNLFEEHSGQMKKFLTEKLTDFKKDFEQRFPDKNYKKNEKVVSVKKALVDVLGLQESSHDFNTQIESKFKIFEVAITNLMNEKDLSIRFKTGGSFFGLFNLNKKYTDVLEAYTKLDAGLKKVSKEFMKTWQDRDGAVKQLTDFQDKFDKAMKFKEHYDQRIRTVHEKLGQKAADLKAGKVAGDIVDELNFETGVGVNHSKTVTFKEDPQVAKVTYNLSASPTSPAKPASIDSAGTDSTASSLGSEVAAEADLSSKSNEDILKEFNVETQWKNLGKQTSKDAILIANVNCLTASKIIEASLQPEVKKILAYQEGQFVNKKMDDLREEQIKVLNGETNLISQSFKGFQKFKNEFEERFKNDDLKNQESYTIFIAEADVFLKILQNNSSDQGLVDFLTFLVNKKIQSLIKNFKEFQEIAGVDEKLKAPGLVNAAKPNLVNDFESAQTQIINFQNSVVNLVDAYLVSLKKVVDEKKKDETALDPLRDALRLKEIFDGKLASLPG